jgi:hypothetical protein
MSMVTDCCLRATATRTVVRYQRERPGELVHIDSQKAGRIPDGGGWRIHGRRGCLTPSPTADIPRCTYQAGRMTMAEAPAIHVGSDTRDKTQEEAMRDADFAIRETGLQVTFTSGPHIGGAGTLEGAGVAVLVTCLSQGDRTFIEVVGASLDSGAAEQARNRVRTITMGAPS